MNKANLWTLKYNGLIIYQVSGNRPYCPPSIITRYWPEIAEDLSALEKLVTHLHGQSS
jgi:hypothetical protein